MQTEPGRVSIFQDYRYYAVWWAFWCGLLTALQPYLGPEEFFWRSKGILLASGIAYGVALATAFAVLQNKLNQQRKKPISWLLAIGLMFAAKTAQIMLLS